VQEKRPVESVSWYDAVYFCNKLSMLMGLAPAYSVNGQTDPAKWNYRPHNDDYISSEVICDYSASGFRLPTEGEWEMAARGGVAGGWNYEYAGSDRIDDVAWYQKNTNWGNDGTHEVGKKKPNALGLYDMSGNVWEWVWETDPDILAYRYYRGGSYYRGADYCEVSFRDSLSANCRSDGVGFRLLRPLN
jgi:formylglycine-generating enzyme required for sulfatase activity